MTTTKRIGYNAPVGAKDSRFLWLWWPKNREFFLLKMINYRRFYANYFGIEIPQGYEIHHIDHNRENNAIENLILIPHDLHMQLHKCCRPDNMADVEDIFKFSKCDIPLLNSVRADFLQIVSAVYKELQYWASCKDLEMYRRKGMIGPMPYSYKQFYKKEK